MSDHELVQAHRQDVRTRSAELQDAIDELVRALPPDHHIHGFDPHMEAFFQGLAADGSR